MGVLLSSVFNFEKRSARKVMVMFRIATCSAFLAVFQLLIPAAGAQTAPAAKPAPQAKPAAPKPVAKTATADADDDVEIPPAAPGSLFPAVIARVNTRPILGRDIESRIQSLLTPIGNPQWKNLKEDYKQELIIQSLGSLIASELVYQKAVASGMKATDAEVQAEFSKAAKNFGSDGEFNSALASRGLDRQSFQREMARSMTVEKYVAETVGKKITITPAEVSKYYEEHKEDFRHPELVRTSQILTAVAEGASAEQDKMALQRSEGILARIKKNEDFAKLAKENSMDETASRGGDLGFAAPGTMDPDYEKAAFALPVGGVSKPVRTRLGYHIIKVTDKKKERISDLDEIRGELTEYLKGDKTNVEFQKVVDGLKSAAKIEILIPIPSDVNPAKATISNPRP
jgi:parvulin-like peptidyl-prolyl isomerase